MYLAKIEVTKPKQIKIGPRRIDCIFVEYVDNSNAYRFLIHNQTFRTYVKVLALNLKMLHFSKISFPTIIRKK